MLDYQSQTTPRETFGPLRQLSSFVTFPKYDSVTISVDYQEGGKEREGNPPTSSLHQIDGVIHNSCLKRSEYIVDNLVFGTFSGPTDSAVDSTVSFDKVRRVLDVVRKA